MGLPADFQFSQSSLQDYVDCPRRFYLRYVRGLAWPALQAEPALEHERHLQQGVQFHRLVHQHVLGVPSEELSRATADANLRGWWGNYLEHGPTELPEMLYPEAVLSAPLGGHRLVAKYDLIAVDVGRRVVILEWKTYRKRPGRRWLAERLQTRIYRYLLVRAGACLNEGQALESEQVEMVYWFANFPDHPEGFAYDAAQYQADEVYLTGLIAEIEGLEEEGFPLTGDTERCQYCRYRSLCRRGIRAANMEDAGEELELDDELDFSLDLEQVAEIEF